MKRLDIICFAMRISMLEKYRDEIAQKIKLLSADKKCEPLENSYKELQGAFEKIYIEESKALIETIKEQ